MQPFFLYAHILFGSLSLLLGGAAIAAKKGSAIHIKSGKWYALSMLFTCVFSLFVSIPKANYFLVCIAFFSYYGVFMGQRYIHLKKIEHKSSIEKIGIAMGFLSSLGMIATAIYFFTHNQIGPGIILTVFGCLFLLGIYEDWKILYKNQEYAYPKMWLEMHIKRMSGGYIATITAFIVVNNRGYVPDLVGWLGPGIIGGVLIGMAIKKIKPKSAIQA